MLGPHLKRSGLRVSFNNDLLSALVWNQLQSNVKVNQSKMMISSLGIERSLIAERVDESSVQWMTGSSRFKHKKLCVCVSICFDCRPLLFKWSVRTRQSGTRVSHFTESFLNFCSSWAACIGNPIPPHPVKIPIFTGQLLSYRRFNGLQF